MNSEENYIDGESLLYDIEDLVPQSGLRIKIKKAVQKVHELLLSFIVILNILKVMTADSSTSELEFTQVSSQESHVGTEDFNLDLSLPSEYASTSNFNFSQSTYMYATDLLML